MKTLLLIAAALSSAATAEPLIFGPRNLESPKHHPSRLLVQYREGREVEMSGMRLSEAVAAVKGTARVVTVDDPTSLLEMKNALAGHPDVEYVGFDYELRINATPNDPRFGELYGMTKTQAPLAWDTIKGGESIVIAVIDTGIAYNHPDLAANMWKNPGETAGNGIDDDDNGYVDDIYGWDFANNDANPMDDNGHGTHCAGTIGAVGNNGVGVAGVNWQTKLMALKFLSSTGSGFTSNALLSLNYAVKNGAKVSSNSYGGGPFDQAFLNGINAAKDKGHLFVAAAGNSSVNNDNQPAYPASYNAANVISVASTTSADALSGFSNFGANTVHLGAPGSGILSTVPTGACKSCNASGYNTLSGTSMATPHVAGAVGLLLSRFSELPYDEVRRQIIFSGDPIGALNGRTVSGRRLNVAAAVAPQDFPGDVSAKNEPLKVDVAWTDRSTIESSFLIERNVTSDDTKWAKAGVAPANAKAFADTSAPDGTTVRYRVRTLRANGSFAMSEDEAEVDARLPRPPSELASKVLGENGGIELKWKENSTSETKIRVERAPEGSDTFVELAELTPNSAAYSDAVPRMGETHQYRLTVENAFGTSQSETLTVKVEAPPELATQALESVPLQAGASGDGCSFFVAFRDDRRSDLALIRRFRDGVLRRTVLGRLTIAAYYAASPYVAGGMKRSPTVYAIVKSVLGSAADLVKASGFR